MSLARFAALTLAALVLWGTAASAGGPLRSFRLGFWSGGAYADEKTGAFTHCSAGVAYDSGVNLFVLVTRQYRWWLGFINPKWSFTPGPKALIRLRLDGAAPFDRFATVPNGQLLLVPLPENTHLIDTFRHSSQLALDAEGQALFFKLNEIPGTIDRLTACVRTSLALDSAATPARSQSASALQSPAGAGVPAQRNSSSPQPLPPAPSGAPATPLPTLAATSSTIAPKPAQPAAAVPAKSSEQKATLDTALPGSADAPAKPAETPRDGATPAAAPEKSAVVTDAGSLSPSSLSADPGSAAADDASSPDSAAAANRPPTSSAANSSTLQAPPAPSVQPAALSAPAAPDAPQSTGEAASRTTAALPPVPAAANKPEAASVRSPLAFTAVNPMISVPLPAPSALAPEPAAGTAQEEVRLATQFLTSARLPNAHLIVSDKPLALADFAAVWRSEDAAGAVKIIPPGPDVSAIAIASNLIAVDPSVCKGDFTSARLRTDVENRAVFSAILTCNEANEERVTQYLIAPRGRGGFVVFAVIRSRDTGPARELDRQSLEGLSRAALRAVAGQG